MFYELDYCVTYYLALNQYNELSLARTHKETNIFNTESILSRTHKETKTFVQENILPGAADYKEEIFKGIENANHFLFIVSPQSVESPYCIEEIEYAQSLNVRLFL